MNIIYRDFSDIGEYFDATRDFGIVDRPIESPSQREAQEYPVGAKKAAGFSEGNLVITDRANKVFGKAKTNFLAHEAYFPSRRAQKLKWDVERQVALNEKIANAKGQEKEDLIAASNEIDEMNRKGNNFFTSLWYGEPGAMYHTPKKSVDALNKLLGQEFSEKPSTGQKVAYYLIGAFPRKITGSAKDTYWDSVKAIAELPEDKREAIYKDINSMHKKRMVSDWVTTVSSQVIPYNPAAIINGVYQGATQPQRYKEIVSANIKSPDKNFSEIGSSLIPR